MQMAAAAVNRDQFPWRPYFQTLSDTGEDYPSCVSVLEEEIDSYIIPAPIKKFRKTAADYQDRRVYLCSATLLIVPPNVFLQWKNEIAQHLEEGALKVLFIESLKDQMPARVALQSYDIILMTKRRFEQEFDPSTYQNRKWESPIKAQDHSPLKDLHFLRIIADEGHSFASNAIWVLKDLCVERRWIISGTPAAGLLGVEVGLATNESSQEQFADSKASHQSALISRQKTSSAMNESRDLRKLGSIVKDFLRLKPWSNSWGCDSASWTKYIMPYPCGRRKAQCLRSLLESLVVRHQIDAVEADLTLPPLYNRVVFLQPSWHDKLSINLFVLSLTANAVTSERVDQDYIFNPRNKVALERLITNLRQSGFHWSGFSSQDVGKTLEISESYLQKPANPCQPNTKDRLLLTQAMDMGRLALESRSWKACTEVNELGIYVEGFPEDSCSAWSLVQREAEEPLLIGATQLIEAQKYVDSRLYLPNPAIGLEALGKKTMEELWQSSESNLPRLTEKKTKSKAEAAQKPRKNAHAQSKQAIGKPALTRKTKTLKSAMKASTIDTVEPLSLDTPVAKAKILGTASAKLSYLIDRVVLLQQEEKILIFYEGDQIAYYIAQAFDLLNIGYRIYTRTLSISERNKYIETFYVDNSCRVMLMNVQLAAHGLHLANASRVFFVNPVWQPNVEAQAIKRAHRIGQTRPVYVETLVLNDTLEDKMLQRRKQMTTEEHQTAQKSLLDDSIIREIIQAARPIPFTQAELLEVSKKMAPLATPQRLFGRRYDTFSAQKDPNVDVGSSTEISTSNMGQRRNKRKAVGFDPAVESPASRPKLQKGSNAKDSGDTNIPSTEADHGNVDLFSNDQTTHSMVDLVVPEPSSRPTRVRFADDVDD